MKHITISNSATYNTEVIPSTSSIEVKDQSSKQIEKPIDDLSTDFSSDTESTCSSDTSNSTSNEDSDNSVKDPDFQIEERRSVKISDDS
ncbi:unnamed protein product [Parnassius apollo]|uniref:(apollo) hypothetical protein n=1 Tax=Parnassius apollo TaxID=110799 RepID=A0A8S3WAF9_PARAO|nr:unnamed protein product [Parnassius apollo]